VASQHALDALDGQEEVRQLGGREVGQAKVREQRAYEHVARQQRLEVDQGEGVPGCEEDLCGVSMEAYGLRVRCDKKESGVLPVPDL
jgi:hypothetical protein